ncbi:CHAT domain-containing tetratricopeptide repeat protein [Reichenbachiella sp.]|uniref:CHAT domain-containing protein n=1 Tax=Reichenbachiella sp. TaxID=2184521 RepID=UPI00329A2AFA
MLAFTLTILLATSLHGQESLKSDTTLANYYYQRGDSLLSQGKYDSALHYLNSSVDLFKSTLYTKRYLESLAKLAKVYSRSHDFARCLETSHLVLKEIGENIEGKESLLAAGYLNIGNVYVTIGSLDSAHFYLNKALAILNEHKGDPYDLSKVYANIGRLYTEEGKYDLALENLLLALSIMEGNIQSDDAQLAIVYNNIGNIYSDINSYEYSLKYFNKAIQLTKNRYGTEHRHLAYFYNNMGLVYFRMGIYHMALEYYLNSIEIVEQAEFVDDMNRGFTYANISDTYRMLKQYDRALEVHQKALDLIIGHFGSNHYYASMHLFNKAEIYFDQGKYREALEQKLSTLKPLVDQFGDTHPLIAESRASVSLIYSKLGDYNLAASQLLKSIKTYKQLHGNKNAALAKIYYNLGIVRYDQKNFKEAGQYFQQSLIANVSNFNDTSTLVNPSLNNSFDPLYLLHALKSKALCWLKNPEIRLDQDKQRLALSTFELCDQQVNQLRRSFLNFEDKIELAKTFSVIYEGAIRLNLELYEVTQDPVYLNKSWQFMEKSKAALLSESVRAKEGKRRGLLPEDLIATEQNNLTEQVYFKSKILQKSNDSLDNKRFKEKLFSLRRTHDSLVEVFKKKYPSYYQLRYQEASVNISDFQKELAANTAMIEYFEGDSTFYVMAISKDQVRTAQIDKSDKINQSVDGFRRVVDLWSKGQNTEETFNQFINYSHKLYALCFADIINQIQIDNSIQGLIIIPDGKLYYVPFEILLSKPSESQTGDYRALDYLIKNYTISYGYSASLVHKDNGSSESISNNYIGFAPSYPNPTGDQTLYEAGQFRDAVADLRWNESEVETIANLLDGKSQLGSEAREDLFKKEAANSSIVHLAMHALIEDNDPMYSKLVFAQSENDSIEDGYLHTYELFGMDLNAEMVVLSACNTGFGKLERGEGIRSLAYGFTSAGCKSTVMSQWSVDDQSTNQIMNLFYQNLNKGMTKSRALSKAKLEFLQSADKAYANPFYWGGFVVFGNTSTIEFDRDNAWTYILASGAFLILISLIFFKSKKRNYS